MLTRFLKVYIQDFCAATYLTNGYRPDPIDQVQPYRYLNDMKCPIAARLEPGFNGIFQVA
jgi:hypothetical protein